MPHAALWVVQHSRSYETNRSPSSFNAARGFVGGAAEMQETRTLIDQVSMPHAALWVVQRSTSCVRGYAVSSFNAARGFVGGAANTSIVFSSGFSVSMPHAALWVVQLLYMSSFMLFF